MWMISMSCTCKNCACVQDAQVQSDDESSALIYAAKMLRRDMIGHYNYEGSPLQPGIKYAITTLKEMSENKGYRDMVSNPEGT